MNCDPYKGPFTSFSEALDAYVVASPAVLIDTYILPLNNCLAIADAFCDHKARATMDHIKRRIKEPQESQ